MNRKPLLPVHPRSLPPHTNPQTKPKVLQRKIVGAQHPQVIQQRRPPQAPPAYQPQPRPKVLQLKSSIPVRPPSIKPGMSPAAPPVYRPQAVPKVLQRKTVAPKHQGHTHPVAPSVYRPIAKKIVQPKVANPHAATMQMYREIPVLYAFAGASKAAYKKRMDEDISPGRNIATFVFQTRPGKAGIARAPMTEPSRGFYNPESNSSHSEKQITNELGVATPFTSPLFKDEVIDWIYTERRPCHRCRPMLQGIEQTQKLRGWDDLELPYRVREDDSVNITVFYSFEAQEAKRELRAAMREAKKAAAKAAKAAAMDDGSDDEHKG